MSGKMPCWFSAESEKSNSSHLMKYNDVALCCVNSIIILLNVMASGTVVYRYYQTRSRQPVSNTLLVFLASLDLIKSTVAQPLYISVFILKFFGVFHCAHQRVTETIICICLGFSFIMATIVLTSERFLAVVYPIYHRVYMQKKVLVYVCLTLFAAWIILLTNFHVIFSQQFQLYCIYLVILSFGLVYTLAVYMKIFRVSRRSVHSLRGENVHSRNSSLRNNGNNHNIERPDTNPNVTPCQVLNRAVKTFNFTAKEKKTLVRILSIIGVLYLTTTPLVANFAYAVVKGTDYFFIHYLYPWTTTAFFISGVINAYVYCYRNEHFCMRKPASRNAAVWSSTDANASNGFEQRRSHDNSTVG